VFERLWQTRNIRFIVWHIRQIREGGLSVFLYKVRRFVFLTLEFLLIALTLPITLPLILVIRALRPIKVIRFGRLESDRIGHLAFEPELYLCERDAGLHDPHTLDVFHYFYKPICNYQLKKMWDRILHTSNLIRPLDRMNRFLPGYKKHIVPLQSSKHEDTCGLFNRTQPHLHFTSEEEQMGAILQQRMGVPLKAPFICFINRDSAYLDTHLSGDFRFHHYRDSSISNYIPAAEELVRRGYFTIRMGAVVKEAIDTTNPHIIDYATKHRSDFMDIYLFAKCHFMIASNSGPCNVGWIFRRPIAFVNIAPFLEMKLGNYLTDIFIPKKYWLIKDKRFMTFKEIIISGAGGFSESKCFLNNGIELIENSAEEITALAVEMDEHLKGTWQTTDEDEALQECFASIWKIAGIQGIGKPRIGTDFLRQNHQLLV
jgi:putative glycosyltransferase (TIGR04372 family)